MENRRLRERCQFCSAPVKTERRVLRRKMSILRFNLSDQNKIQYCEGGKMLSRRFLTIKQQRHTTLSISTLLDGIISLISIRRVHFTDKTGLFKVRRVFFLRFVLNILKSRLLFLRGPRVFFSTDRSITATDRTCRHGVYLQRWPNQIIDLLMSARSPY